MTKRKNPEDKLKAGKPSTYTHELGVKICRAIATSTDSITKICARNPDFPNRECIWGWRIDFPIFGNMYDKAKRAQADLLAEEIQDISDNDSQDKMINDKGNEVQNSEYIARSRLRVETRKWIACKLLPKVYGDKIETENALNQATEILQEVRDIAKKCMKPI